MNIFQPKIYVAGHRGMVGSAIARALHERGQTNIVTRTHAELDLTNQGAVRTFFAEEKPEQVYLAAARVGGIHANNTYPAEFIYINLMIEANVIDAAFQMRCKKATVSWFKLHLSQTCPSTHARGCIVDRHARTDK